MEKPILIASASIDHQTYEPVIRILNAKGYQTVTYKTDKVLSGSDSFTMSVDEAGELQATYNDTAIAPGDISAAWYRKISNFAIENAGDNVAKQLSISNEIRSLHNTIWPLYPDDLWLNAPDNMANADRKLRQLMVAKELGFLIPHTVISSAWESIESPLAPYGEAIAAKMIKGVIADQNHLQAMYTTKLNKNQVATLKTYTIPFPGLYQPMIDKAREWRVTTVGEDVYPVAIYTSMDAKDDWRKLQLTSSVEFKTEKMPEGLDELCVAYLGKMGLKYGAFDFVEKPNGEIVFLECNPNGQYGWLEDSLELPISQSVASEILKIARANR